MEGVDIDRMLKVVLLTVVWFHCIGCVYDAHWERHKQHHRLVFEPAEELKRHQIFSHNKKYIDDFNSRSSSSTLRLNKFAHMEKEELLRKKQRNRPAVAHTPPQPKSYYTTNKVTPNEHLPEYKNWAFEVPFTVRNQGQCGSCWAMAGVTVIEYYYAIHHKKPVTLSPQYMMDCEPENKGCDGDAYTTMLDYARLNGLVEESLYPYRAENGECADQHLEGATFYNVSGYLVRAGTVDELKSLLVNYGPVAIGTTVNSKSFLFYDGGIYNHTSCSNDPEDSTHAMTLIGYGFDKNFQEEYFIFQNSWGTDWGINGFGKISAKNLCGFDMYPTVPL